MSDQIRNCRTCAHCVPHENGREGYDHCRRFQLFCSNAVTFGKLCGRDLKEWTPKTALPPPPPRRSLRRWLYDLLFAP